MVAVWACCSACASSTPTATPSTKPVAKAPFGARCSANADCESGLFCLDSDYSPFHWCTRFCPESTPGDHCGPESLGATPGFCIQMPAGWRGPSQPFCAPECGKLASCTDLDASWESCEKAAYKNIVLYTDRPTHVCMADSANGQPVVDPLTCDWESKVSDPDLEPVKGYCKAYCAYKTTCQLFDPKKENANCCTWHCFTHLTPGHVIDNQAVSAIKCYNQAFGVSYQNTNKVCSGPVDDCSPKWGPPP